MMDKRTAPNEWRGICERWPDFAIFTPRQRDVLLLLADGLDRRTVAERLGIGRDAVQFFVGQIRTRVALAERQDAKSAAGIR